MSIFSRLGNIFRVQSNEGQLFIISIGLFLLQWLTGYKLWGSIFQTILVVAGAGLISWLIIKIFDSNGDYSLHTIWKVLMVVYAIYYVVRLIL